MSVISQLTAHGESKVSVLDIWEDCNKGAIPVYLLEEYKGCKIEDDKEIQDLGKSFSLRLI